MKHKRILPYLAGASAVLAAFGALAGCGGGGGTAINPIASPSPPATIPTGAVRAQVIDAASAGGTTVAVQVNWSAPAFSSAANVVQYHVFRNNRLVGVASKMFPAFEDKGASASLSYFSISPADNTKLNPLTAGAPTAFGAGISYTYRVTALYVTEASASLATPEYAEAEVGTSDSVLPFPFSGGGG